MAVNAVEMVRKIRDRHYQETKDLSIDDQIKAVKGKSGRLLKELQKLQRLTASSI